MKKRFWIIFVIFLLLGTMNGTGFATPFSTSVQNDSYGISQGVGNITTVPTARDNNDGLPDINDAVNQLLGTTYMRNSAVDN